MREGEAAAPRGRLRPDVLVDRAGGRGRGARAAALFEYADVGRMRRDEVVGVRAVLELEFPVGVVGEADRAGHEFDAVLALVHDDVDRAPRVAEVRLKGGHIGRQAGEHQAAVGPEARDRRKIVLDLSERFGVSGLALRGDSYTFAAGVIGPAVVGAAMVRAVALAGVEDHRALVATAVEESPEPALCIAHHHDRRATDHRGDEIVGIGDLRLEADEVPGRLEDVLHLEFEHRRIPERVAMHAEPAFAGAVVEESVEVGRGVERLRVRCHGCRACYPLPLRLQGPFRARGPWPRRLRPWRASAPG